MLDYRKVMELNSQYENIFTSERWWVKPINQNRDQQDDFNNLFQEMIDSITIRGWRYHNLTISRI